MTRTAVCSHSAGAAITLASHGIHPVLVRIPVARGVVRPDEPSIELTDLLPPAQPEGIDNAVRCPVDAIAAKKRLLIIADCDCDGATACAVGVRGLYTLGTQVSYIVPNRFEYGHGLPSEIVALAVHEKPGVLVTVDNGIADVAGVAAANALDIDVVVTDHHVPRTQLPEARVIINPNQSGCGFPSKDLTGVGVMFYMLPALRAGLRKHSVFISQDQPHLDALLDLVALGTVADVAKLDTNNRLLVTQGLKRMRAGRMCPGIVALPRVANREARRASVFDLGFGLSPRLSAAERLADMSLDVGCLPTDDYSRAMSITVELNGMNRERREIEAGMRQEVLATLDSMNAIDGAGRHTIAVYDETWHQGVIDIVAPRIKNKFHRPVFTFAPGDDGVIKGSGRSIPGFHPCDALDAVHKRSPGLIVKLGGHAMAAGFTLCEDGFETFVATFKAVGREWLTEVLLSRVLETDGEADLECFTPQFVELLEIQVRGQGFPALSFCGEFDVLSQAVLKDKHLKLKLGYGKRYFDAIWFNHVEPLGVSTYVAYRLDNSTFNGIMRMQMVIKHTQ